MPLKQKIKDWLSTGADYEVGLRLYVRAVGKGHPTIYILRRRLPHYHSILITALCHRAGLPVAGAGVSSLSHQSLSVPHDPPALTTQYLPTGQAGPLPNTKNKLRQDYTFLSEPGTPPELKILVSNKITAYNHYKTAHARLFDSLSAQEELDNVRHLVQHYIENHNIHRELHHYQKTKNILGRHPIFEEMKRLKELRGTSIVDLMNQKRRLEHNIRRLKKQIRDNNQPHLRTRHEQKLTKYENTLTEINRILST